MISQLQRKRTEYLRSLLLTGCALALGAGLVVATQNTSRADRLADPTDLERRPMWVPGEDIPMISYLGKSIDLPPAPPR